MSDRSPRLWLARLRESPMRWIAYGIIAGIGSGLVAVVFSIALEAAGSVTFGWLAGMPQPLPPGEQGLLHIGPETAPDPRPWVFFLLPTLGGLISGLLVYRFAPEAEGPGTDEFIREFHSGRGLVRPRVPVIKALATLATLATGGSAGKEGPIAQIGSGIGSMLGTRLGLSARDRRILLLAGAAGGLGAIFRAPLGSAITAIEVLYTEDFESDALIPCVIASVTGYVLFVTLAGGARIFAVPEIPLVTPLEVPGYLLLALVSVPLGALYIRMYRETRSWFARLRLPRTLRPMLGGLGVGVVGLFFPEAYGAGFGYIQQALDGNLLLSTMAWVVLAKMVTTSLTIGSGGSGGVFGPTIFIGGMLGGVVGYTGNLFIPAMFEHPEAYVLVGMASFFAGVASAPIGAMLMVAEMSGGYALLPPLMLVSVLSIVLARNNSIYSNQVRDRFHSPAHVGDLTINVLEEMKVEDVYQPGSDVPTVAPDSSFQIVRDLIIGARLATVPVVDGDGALVGLLTAEQIRPVIDESQLDSFVVARDICAPPVSLRIDDDLYRAHELFRQSGCPQLPIVEDTGAEDSGEATTIIGMIDYRDMMQAYGRELTRRRAD